MDRSARHNASAAVVRLSNTRLLRSVIAAILRAHERHVLPNFFPLDIADRSAWEAARSTNLRQMVTLGKRVNSDRSKVEHNTAIQSYCPHDGSKNIFINVGFGCVEKSMWPTCTIITNFGAALRKDFIDHRRDASGTGTITYVRKRPHRTSRGADWFRLVSAADLHSFFNQIHGREAEREYVPCSAYGMSDAVIMTLKNSPRRPADDPDTTPKPIGPASAITARSV